MFGNKENKQNQSSIFDQSELNTDNNHKIVIDFHDRKTQMIAAGIAVILIILGIWLHARLTAPMVEKAVPPAQYASSRTVKNDKRHSNTGQTAKEISGHQTPDGFHQ